MADVNQTTNLDATSAPQCVIIGGGAAGATTALLLAKAGVTTTLVDAGNPKNIDTTHHDSRVFALSPASIKLFEHAGIWQHIARRADYHAMKVWFKNGAGELNFADGFADGSADGANLGGHAGTRLGSMVEPRIINHAIFQAIQEVQTNPATQDDLTTHYGVRVKGIDNIRSSYMGRQTGANFAIELDNGTHLLAKFLVGADGRGSFVRRSAYIGVDTLDYKQTAICCAIKTQKSHGGCARQVFLPTGPLALLPLADLPDTQADDLGKWQSVVWTLPTNQALDLLSKPEEVLKSELALAANYELGDVVEIRAIASFPLNAIHAKTYTMPHLALVGDAAHGVHPLAGQGLNLGLLDVGALTDALLGEYERSAQAVFASSAALAQYEASRRTHNAAMMHAFSAIGFVFAEHKLPLWSRFEWLRSEVVNRVGKSAGLSAFFGQQAAGLGQLSKRWR